MIVLLIFCCSFVWAVNLAPLVKRIESFDESRLVYTVSNSSSSLIPVEVSILEVVGVKSHKEIRVETDDIVLSHEQFILRAAPLIDELNSNDPKTKQLAQVKLAKARKIIRAEYIADDIPIKERVFRIIAREPDIPGLAIDNSTDNAQSNAQMKIRFQMEGLIFVAPKNANPNLYLDDISFKNGKGKFILKNSGNASMFLQMIEDIQTKKVLSGIKVNLLNGESYFLTNKNFKKQPFKRVLPNHAIKYEFDYDKSHKIKDIQLVLPEA